MARAEYRNAGRAGHRLYPRVIYEIVIERVAAGASLAQVCEDPSMPCAATFRNALTEDMLLSKAYADAVRAQIERRTSKTTA